MPVEFAFQVYVPTFVLAYRKTFKFNLRASEASKIANSGIFLFAKVLKYFPWRDKVEPRRLLTRGVEPPRVSPYGPEPYASAIPPRERRVKRPVSCPPSRQWQGAIPCREAACDRFASRSARSKIIRRNRRPNSPFPRARQAGGYRARRLRARDSIAAALRFLPNDRRRSA